MVGGAKVGRVATKVMSVRVCDVCGEPATEETLRFGWQSSFYESDVCETHGRELRDLMETITKSARPMGSTVPAPKPAKRESFVAPAARRRRRIDTAEVRAWAKKQGIEVSDKGRVPEALIEQWEKATRSAAGGSKRS